MLEIDPKELFLQDLDKKLWKFENYRDTFRIRKIKTYNQSLSEDEWTTIKSILEENIFVVQVTPFRFGFTCGIHIIKIIEPIYPGIPFEFENILSLESYHLPGNNTNGDKSVGFDEGWEKFSPFFNNSKNIELLKRVGLEIPKSKEYYEY